MGNFSATAVVRGVLLTACAFAASRAAPPVSTEEGKIRELIQKYAAAVDSEPVNIDLASQVWAHSPDVSFIHPLGDEHGWEEIKRNFYQNTMEALFSERKLTTRDVNIHVYGDGAWAEFYWRFAAKLRKGDGTVETNGRETQIYHKIEPDRWVLVHVHYSAMPAVRPQ